MNLSIRNGTTNVISFAFVGGGPMTGVTCYPNRL